MSQPSQEQIIALLQEAQRSASAVQLADKSQDASASDVGQPGRVLENKMQSIVALGRQPE